MTQQQNKSKETQLLNAYKMPFRDFKKFSAAFNGALNITKGYTLSRDVKDCVDAALRREKRIQ